jgi:hypothetical protein
MMPMLTMPLPALNVSCPFPPLPFEPIEPGNIFGIDGGM